IRRLPDVSSMGFDTVLVANRGEIAVRVIRTLKAMGIRSVAVYSDADANALHVASADVAVAIGPAPARESYLNVAAIVDAAVRAGAQAVHPGYGFLSENADFAAALAAAGVTFIGQPVRAIQTMGDKIAAKGTVSAFGVPVVPGIARPGLSDQELIAAADEIGYPVLVKPSARGGDRPPVAAKAPRRWRRKGHAYGRAAARPASRAGQRPSRIGRRVRRRHAVLGAICAAPQAHRGSGTGRHVRQRRALRRAGMQPAAPPSKGHRGGAVTAAGRRNAGPNRRRRMRYRPQRRLHRRGHGGVHRLRPPARRG